MPRIWPAVCFALFSAAAFAQEDGGLPDADAGAPMTIEEFAPAAATDASPAIESFAAAPTGPTVRVFGTVQTLASVDTRFDSAPMTDLAENVAELRAKASVGVDVKVNDFVRVVLEGRVQFRGVTQRDFQRTK